LTSATTAAWQSAEQTAATSVPAIASSESDVISFDDSLLLDDDTSEISLDASAEAGMAGIGSAAKPGAGDEDFFKMVASDETAAEEQANDEAIDWASNERETDEHSDRPNDAAEPAFAEEEFRLADEGSEPATFEPVERAGAGAPVGAPFGLLPRRRSKANPVVMTAGILGGGILGLAIGYGILFWGFAKDPFKLAAYLPDSLKPAALKSSGSQSLARTAPFDSSADASSDASASPGNNESFPAFDAGNSAAPATDDGGKDAMPGDNAAGADTGNTGKSADGATPSDIDPFGTEPTKGGQTEAGKTKGDDPIGGFFSTEPAPKASLKGPAAGDPAAAAIDPFGTGTSAGKSDGTAIDPLADPFADSAKSQPKAAPTKHEAPTVNDTVKDPFGSSSDTKSDPFGSSPTDAKSDPFATPSETVDTSKKAADGSAKGKDAGATDVGRETKERDAETKSGTVVDAQKPSDPFADPTNEAAKADPLTEPAEVLGPTTDVTYSSDDLLSAVDAARTTNDEALALPASATLDQKNRVNGPYYKNLSRVAETFTSLDSKQHPSLDRATSAAIEAVLDAVPNQKQLEEVGKLSGYWYQRDLGKGIVLGGIVKDSTPQGKLVESVVETLGKPLKGEPQKITVVSPAPLTDDANRPVLVVGTIIKDPKKNLRGYEGSADKVVWAALSMDPTDPAASRDVEKRPGAAKQTTGDAKK
jgi:hypothetical protein